MLVDAAGQPVMAGRHPLGDLAPRDVVAAAMQQRMAPGDHLWLDATGLGRAALEREFPTVTALCRARGIDPASEPIPVAPGAHYACGGIRAGLDGLTSVAGLYAVGEAASTGVHGANRLASNSLTEALITGQRTGELLGRHLPGPAARLGPSLGPPPARAWTRPPGPAWPPPCPGMRACSAIRPAWKHSGWRSGRPGRPGRADRSTWPPSRRPICTRYRCLWPRRRWPARRAEAATAGVISH